MSARKAPDYAIGDLVVYRSGGPLMTVVESDGSQLVCEWFRLESRSDGQFVTPDYNSAHPYTHRSTFHGALLRRPYAGEF